MNAGLVIGRIFIVVLIVIAFFCVVKADTVAQWTFHFRKKDWRLTENSIPTLALICRVWNGVMLLVLSYLFVTLPNFMK